jgi:hypothetical protein
VASAAALVSLLALAGPLRAQDAATVPAPIIAPVLATTGVPELAIRSVYVDPASDPAEPTVVVQFAGAFTLPPDGYRLSVFFGDPEAVAIRASLRTVGGQLVGSLETDESGDFVEIGPLSVTTTEDGAARLTVPADAIPETGSVWVVAEVADPVGSTVSPLFPIDQFFAAGPPGTLSASTWAWMTPPGGGLPTVVDLAAPPALTVEGDIVRLTYPDVSPVEIAGQGRTSFVDAVRIAPDFATAGQAPYLIAVDHVGGNINLLDGTQPLPATLDGPDSWLAQPFPLGGVEEGTVIEFDLSEVAAAFGITLSPETTTLGAARSVVLDDGTVVRADGVQATLDWFGASLAPADAGSGDTDAAGAADDAAESSDDEAFPWLLVVAGTAALALVVGLGVWWVLGNMRSHAQHPAGLLDLKVRPRQSDDAPLALDRHEPLPRRVGGEGAADDPADGDRDRSPDTIELREPTPASASHDVHRAAGANAEPGSSLDGLFHMADGENAIDVPDLALFDDPATPPSERPAPPRKRPAQSDELTRALFEHD